MKRILPCGATAGAALALAFGVLGCSHDQASQHRPATTVVASTDVWGSVASAVAGEHATVTSILRGSVDDPHSYEASPAATAEIIDASLVVYNGGGYDRWVEKVLAGRPGVESVDAYSLLYTPVSEPGPANEHVSYDIPTATAVAGRIADRLATIDPPNATSYRANAAEFGREAATINADAKAIAAAHPSASVVATEPVAHYLLAMARLTDLTPTGFASAVEQGDDPSPADVAAMLDLLESRQVSALLFNPQTESATTRQIEAAARRAGVPVVTVTETLPSGTDYLTWQRQTVQQLAAALQTNR